MKFEINLENTESADVEAITKALKKAGFKPDKSAIRKEVRKMRAKLQSDK